MKTVNNPLSNAQMELLKLFSTGLSDTDMKELLVKFYSEKSIQSADEAWGEKN